MTVEPTTMLRAQVNRFMGPSAPAAYRLRDKPVAPEGPVDMDVAIHAVVIVQKRAAEAYQTDPSSLELLNRANAGFADPVGFVTRNLDSVIQTIAIYGDLHGVPRGALLKQGQGVPMPLIIGAVALGIYLLTRK